MSRALTGDEVHSNDRTHNRANPRRPNMNSVLVVLRGGPFDGRQLTVTDWPEPVMVESLPQELPYEGRVRARYLAKEPAGTLEGPREMIWDEAKRVGGIHHA